MHKTLKRDILPMTRTSEGWIHTAQIDCTAEFSASHISKRIVYHKKVQQLPPLQIHYDTPRSPTGKEWNDQSLLSNLSVNNYLAQSDAFQRASFANIVEKWKEHEKNEASRLIASFDSHYNMKIRFRKDDKLNRSSEMKYGPGATYYRFIGNESNPKHDKPCGRHKRRIQEYEERHIRELLKIPPKTKSRSEPYFLTKMKKLPPIETTIENSPTVRSFESFAEDSQHSIS